jgi:hypothetical protein
MNRLVVAAGIALTVSAGGCGSGSSSSQAKYAKYANFSSHGYQIDVEIRDDLPHSLKGSSTVEGSGKEVEQIDIRTGDVALAISGGKVTLNGEPRGVEARGDRLRVMLDGKLFVNDAERGQE